MGSLLLRTHARWACWIGAQPATRVIWALACLFSCWVLLDIYRLQVSGGIAQSAYDAMVRARVLVAAPDPRIVVLDIDEPSLKKMSAEFGRWPWPRDTLASVLDYVEKQEPAAIVWDILFADVDRLSPGGDAAFDAAARRSRHSHFPVARLHDSSDDQSQISRAVLPTLWVPGSLVAAPATALSTVALIPPALPAVASAPLGYNNGYVDSDGVLRRYRSFETLRDGSAIQSIAMSVLSALDPPGYAAEVAALDRSGHSNQLIAWRRSPRAYPHYSIADVFEAADSGKAVPGLPSLQGKIVLIGSTAASLHDIHPTPLAADQPGVDSLATAIDNAVNHRHLYELARWQNALIAIALCLALAAWVQYRKFSSLSLFTFALPAGLLFISYLTLNGSPVFVDLHLSAGLAMLFLAVLRYWNQSRRDFWCEPSTLLQHQDLALWPLVRDEPWTEVPLDQLIDFVEQHLPQARLVVPDVQSPLFQRMRWPELARHASILGPQADLLRVQSQCSARIARLCQAHHRITPLAGQHQRECIVQQNLQLWSTLETTPQGE